MLGGPSHEAKTGPDSMGLAPYPLRLDPISENPNPHNQASDRSLSQRCLLCHRPKDRGLASAEQGEASPCAASDSITFPLGVSSTDVMRPRLPKPCATMSLCTSPAENMRAVTVRTVPSGPGSNN